MHQSAASKSTPAVTDKGTETKLNIYVSGVTWAQEEGCAWVGVEVIGSGRWEKGTITC